MRNVWSYVKDKWHGKFIESDHMVCSFSVHEDVLILSVNDYTDRPVFFKKWLARIWLCYLFTQMCLQTIFFFQAIKLNFIEVCLVFKLFQKLTSSISIFFRIKTYLRCNKDKVMFYSILMSKQIFRQNMSYIRWWV